MFEEEDGNDSESVDKVYGLKMSFWIDTDAYSDGDRNMFVCGFEFCQFLDRLEAGDEINQPIHRENESRCRMACGKWKRKCKIEQIEGDEWSNIVVSAV